MTDHLVHVGGELARERPELLGALRLFRRPRELAAHRPRRRSIVGLVDVRQRHRLAAVLLADLLVVRQVDADRRHGAGVAGFDHHVDGVGDNALDAGLAVLRLPRHAILEPLRVGGDGLDALRLVLVDVEDQPFPRALHAARIEVDLDEAVDGVDRRVLVLHPRDVVGLAIGFRAGAIELDQRVERLGHRRFGERLRGLEVLDDLGDVAAVLLVDTVDLFLEFALLLHEPRVESVLFGETFQVGHRHVRVQVVGARLEDVLAGTRRLVGDDRIDVGIEEHRLQPRELAVDASSSRVMNFAPPFAAA